MNLHPTPRRTYKLSNIYTNRTIIFTSHKYNIPIEIDFSYISLGKLLSHLLLETISSTICFSRENLDFTEH